MMLFKVPIVTVFILLARGPSVFSYDTLKIEATLDTSLKAIHGSLVIQIPENFQNGLYEFYLPANKFSGSDFDRQGYPAGVDMAGYHASMTIDSVMLDGIDVTERFSTTQTRGVFDCATDPVAGKALRLRFGTQLPEYGTSLLATNGEYFLGGWFPIPAFAVNDEPLNYNCSNFTEPVGNYYIYDVSLTAPDNFIVAAPVQPLNITTDTGIKTYYYHFGPAVDFALALSPAYEVHSAVQSGTILRYYFRDYEKILIDDLNSAATFAFDYMSNCVGPYIYSQLNIVLICAAKPVGLEYPGLIALFSPRGGALISNYYEYLAIREVVHQWFYAMIYSDQCAEPWLNKAVAEYFALEIAEQYWGKDANLVDFGGFKATFTDDIRLNARLTEGKSPINSGAAQFASEIEFATAVQDRGAMTVATICNLMGDSLTSIFWKAYYQRYLLKRASTDSLLALLEDIAGPIMSGQANYLLNTTELLDYSASALSYRQIDSITYESSFILGRSGTALIPVEYDVILYNDDTLTFIWDSDKYSELIRLESPYPARAVIVDPDFRMAVDINLLNNSILVSADNRPAWRLSSGIMFLVESIFSLMGGW